MINQHKNKFDNLYITPVQRIPRYVMFIRDILKKTDERNPDFEQLSFVGGF